MGLLSSKSKSSVDNSIDSTVTNTQVTNTNQTDNSSVDNSRTEIDNSLDTEISGLGVVGSNNQVTQISTDQGSVEAGRRIGEAALDLVGENQRAVNDTLSGAVDRSLDFGEAALEESFSFGGKSLDLAGKALQVQSEATGKGFNALSSAIDKASQATRSDTADTLQKLAKYGAVAIGVIGLGFVVSMFAKRGAA